MNQRLNSKGMGVLPLVAGISVTAMIAVGMISQMGIDTLTRSSRAYTEWETNLSNKVALSLGGYFVAHNLVVCREQGWEDLVNKNQKCRWGGQYHTPEISMSTYGIKSATYEEDALVLSISNSEVGTKVIAKLRMDLVDWSKQENFRTMVGEIPVWNALTDDDQFVVFMKASTELEFGKGETKVVSKTGAIRRPIGTPNIQIRVNDSQASCVFECEAGDVLTPNPECRGPLEAPPGESDALLGVRVSNTGPGAIYRLKYERTTHFNQDVYPGRADEKQVVDAIPTQEIFMPGQQVDREMVRKCYPPIVNRTTETITQETEGNSNETNTSTTVSRVTSFRSLSSESFDISPSRFDPQNALQSGFEDRYDAYDPRTYTPNPSPSVIEPKRLGTTLPSIEVVSPQETINETTRTMVIRQRVNECWSCNSDGDGDGDN